MYINGCLFKRSSSNFDIVIALDITLESPDDDDDDDDGGEKETESLSP